MSRWNVNGKIACKPLRILYRIKKERKAKEKTKYTQLVPPLLIADVEIKAQEEEVIGQS